MQAHLKHIQKKKCYQKKYAADMKPGIPVLHCQSYMTELNTMLELGIPSIEQLSVVQKRQSSGFEVSES